MSYCIVILWTYTHRYIFFWGGGIFASLSFPEGVSFVKLYASTGLLVVMPENNVIQRAGKLKIFTKGEEV